MRFRLWRMFFANFFGVYLTSVPLARGRSSRSFCVFSLALFLSAPSVCLLFSQPLLVPGENDSSFPYSLNSFIILNTLIILVQWIFMCKHSWNIRDTFGHPRILVSTGLAGRIYLQIWTKYQKDVRT